MNKQIIQKLAKLASQLDKKGLYKEADEVDGLIKKCNFEESYISECGRLYSAIRRFEQETSNYIRGGDASEDVLEAQQLAEDLRVKVGNIRHRWNKKNKESLI